MTKIFKLIIISSLYVSNPALGNPVQQSCDAAFAISAKIMPLAKGEVAALQVQARPTLLPELNFTGSDGAPRKLSDLRGKVVLLNLWATWCAPCRQEMPALDRLQAKLGDKDFEVVAINIDTRNPDKPKQFLADIKVTNLTFYADPSARIFQDLKNAGKAIGMPTTLLIDSQGCELGNMPGPADWASEDAEQLIKATTGK
jgi:thiol-disulfide isomerase/thioredoxin